MRAVRVQLALAGGIGMLAVGACSGETPPPVVRTVTATVTAAPAASAAPPSPKLSVPGRVYDTRTMETDVAKLLTETYKLAGVGAVTCPANQPVVHGAKFECTVDIAGTKKPVGITATDDTGRYQVDPPR